MHLLCECFAKWLMLEATWPRRKNTAGLAFSKTMQCQLGILAHDTSMRGCLGSDSGVGTMGIAIVCHFRSSPSMVKKYCLQVSQDFLSEGSREVAVDRGLDQFFVVVNYAWYQGSGEVLESVPPGSPFNGLYRSISMHAKSCTWKARVIHEAPLAHEEYIELLGADMMY